jgi:hypothetical protein
LKRQIHSNVALSEMKGGAVEELFQAAIGQVLANIDDVNTSETAKRSIKITFTFPPKSDRAATNVDVKVETKLAGNKPVETFMTVKKDGADYLGFEPEQEAIRFDNATN